MLPQRWPMFWEEVRRRMRGDRAFLVQLLYGVVLVLFLMGYASITGVGAAPREWSNFGRLLWHAFLLIQLIVMVLITPGLTAGALSTEREQGTLEQLFLTPMSTLALVAGKYLGALGQLVVLLLSGLPVVGMVFVYGGVSPAEMATGYLLVLATGFFYAAVGYLASCYFTRMAAAVAWAYGFMLICLFGLPLLFIVLSLTNLIGPTWAVDYLWQYTFNPFIPFLELNDKPEALWGSVITLTTGTLAILIVVSLRMQRVRGAAHLFGTRRTLDEVRGNSPAPKTSHIG